MESGQNPPFEIVNGPSRKIEQIYDRKITALEYPNSLRIYGHRHFFLVILAWSNF
jgi:hypothetical protein